GRHTRWPRDWSSDVCSSDLDCRTIIPESSLFTAIEALPKSFTDYTVIFQDGASIMQFIGGRNQAHRSRSHTDMCNVRLLAFTPRSEERRVGKECGCRLGRWR